MEKLLKQLKSWPFPCRYPRPGSGSSSVLSFSIKLRTKVSALAISRNCSVGSSCSPFPAHLPSLCGVVAHEVMVGACLDNVKPKITCLMDVKTCQNDVKRNKYVNKKEKIFILSRNDLLKNDEKIFNQPKNYSKNIFKYTFKYFDKKMMIQSKKQLAWGGGIIFSLKRFFKIDHKTNIYPFNCVSSKIISFNQKLPINEKYQRTMTINE